MITLFETYNNTKKIIVDDIVIDLKVEIQYPEDSVVIAKSLYNIDVIDYFKEILLDKEVVFLSVNALEDNPHIQGKVVDVSQFAYQDEFFITVKLNSEKDDWNIINNHVNILVKDYDAENKPIHKEVKMKKEATKYNI